MPSQPEVVGQLHRGVYWTRRNVRGEQRANNLILSWSYDLRSRAWRGPLLQTTPRSSLHVPASCFQVAPRNLSLTASRRRNPSLTPLPRQQGPGTRDAFRLSAVRWTSSHLEARQPGRLRVAAAVLQCEQFGSGVQRRLAKKRCRDPASFVSVFAPTFAHQCQPLFF